VKTSEIVTVEATENAVVKLDDLPPFPMVRYVADAGPDVVGHIDPERAENMRT
jgi:hypothetical protein